MKKVIPILAVIAILASACGAGNAEPTAIPLPTAFPTNTPPSINAPADVEANAASGEERPSGVDGMPAVYIPDGTFRIKNKLLNHCWKMWHACVITWDGLVVPCCFDKDATHRLGDLKNDPFRTIWAGTRYQEFRSALLKGRNQIDICTNCTEGSKIWA